MRSLLFLFPAVMSLAQPPGYEVIIAKRVMVPMRDGVKLATNIYRPGRDGSPVEGKFPVISERTPYPRDWSEWNAHQYVPHGYVMVVQSVRGRLGSEGHWTMFLDDGNDGADTAKWLGKQPWFGRGIGTMGTSYPGGTQHAMAVGNAPYLKAMIPIDAASNMGLFGIRHNGAFELRFFNWVFNAGASPETLPDFVPDELAQAEWKKLSDRVP